MKLFLSLSFAALACSRLLGADAPPPFENPADYPLMGDWGGKWIGPTTGREISRPEFAAQLLPMGEGIYRVVFLPETYKRAQPYAELTAKLVGSELRVDHGGWKVTFAPGISARGTGELNGGTCEFELKKLEWKPPTLGLAPPEGATVLFDGTSLDAWQQDDGSPCRWKIVDGAMETVSQFWSEQKQGGNHLGNIRTRKTFGSLTFHMEFRYPVEEQARGQGRGNSGLFFLPIGELQILNSYTNVGWWNEAGSVYELVPAKVNAAGPPLEWQTYDVKISTQPDGKALLSSKLNGHSIHHLEELPCDSSEITVLLQDHINRLQFRNIWLVED